MGQPGRNLDVYAADVGRVEVLSGPQGTLFGASSQAGVVRMITNKPVIFVVCNSNPYPRSIKGVLFHSRLGIKMTK